MSTPTASAGSSAAANGCDLRPENFRHASSRRARPDGGVPPRGPAHRLSDPSGMCAAAWWSATPSSGRARATSRSSEPAPPVRRPRPLRTARNFCPPRSEPPLPGRLRLVVAPLLALMPPSTDSSVLRRADVVQAVSREWTETSLDRQLAELMEACWYIDRRARKHRDAPSSSSMH